MLPRNAYILSGALHLVAFGLIVLLASKPPTQVKLLRRYQPVRLVSLPGKPGPTPAKQETKPEAPAVKPKPKAEKKVKPKVEPKETQTKTAATGTQTKTKTETKDASGTKTGTGEGGQSGARLDGTNFPYPYYLSNLQIKILSNFKPIISAKKAKGLKAVVFFVVGKSGKITDVKLESKSGHFLFDQEAQRAVLRSNPLPALPPAFGSDRLGVHFEFVASQ